MSQTWFRAPHFEEIETCHECGLAIRPGEIIGEFSDSPVEYLHEDCFQSAREDQAAAA